MYRKFEDNGKIAELMETPNLQAAIRENTHQDNIINKVVESLKYLDYIS